MDKMNKTDDKPISARFVMAYLRQDGVFILRILGMNANDLVVSEILAELYNNYRTNRIVTINKAQNRRDEVPVWDFMHGRGKEQLKLSDGQNTSGPLRASCLCHTNSV